MPEELNIETASTDLAADILGNDRPAPDGDDALDSAIDSVEADAGKDAATGDDKDADATDKADAKPTAKANGEDKATAEADIPMPDSWAKDQLEIWNEMTPRARQQYINREKQMLDGLDLYKTDAKYGRDLRPVLAKYENIMREQGLQAPQALDFLFNAHQNLSSADKGRAQAYLERVARTYGLTLGAVHAPKLDAEGKPLPVAETPPEVREALERLNRIEGALTAEQTRAVEAARTKAAADVEAFAADPAHPHFDACAEDIAKFIKAGETLESAYEKAVWANPVTREKEIASRQQAADKAQAEKVKAAALAAKKATSTNVKGRDTMRSPTESRATVANMDDVLRETYAEIKSRH